MGSVDGNVDTGTGENFHTVYECHKLAEANRPNVLKLGRKLNTGDAD